MDYDMKKRNVLDVASAYMHDNTMHYTSFLERNIQDLMENIR